MIEATIFRLNSISSLLASFIDFFRCNTFHILRLSILDYISWLLDRRCFVCFFNNICVDLMMCRRVRLFVLKQKLRVCFKETFH
jgi:hypothetical protein